MKWLGCSPWACPDQLQLDPEWVDGTPWFCDDWICDVGESPAPSTGWIPQYSRIDLPTKKKEFPPKEKETQLELSFQFPIEVPKKAVAKRKRRVYDPYLDPVYLRRRGEEEWAA